MVYLLFNIMLEHKIGSRSREKRTPNLNKDNLVAPRSRCIVNNFIK